MIKVIASDMDGTLLGDDHRIAPETLAAIRRACDAGIRFMVATGRNFPGAMEELKGTELTSFRELAGEIEVGGPDLAHSLTDLGLIDEYRLYVHPVVLGRGKPYFAAARPPLRLVASDRIDQDVIRLTYVPA